MAILYKDTDGDRIVSSPWANPKLTIGEALDLRIQEARKKVEDLCVQKAKLEAMDWLKLPFHETRNLLQVRDPF